MVKPGQVYLLVKQPSYTSYAYITNIRLHVVEYIFIITSTINDRVVVRTDEPMSAALNYFSAPPIPILADEKITRLIKMLLV